MKRRLRRMVSLVCALALCLGLLPAGALPAKAAPSAQTVEGVSPVGTTINVFDYWVNERGEAGRATDGSTDKTSGINAGGRAEIRRGIWRQWKQHQYLHRPGGGSLP